MASMGSRAAVVLALFVVQCSATEGGRRAAAGPGVFDPGPAVGQALPSLELPDQDGRPQSFRSLRGPKGLVLNFNRWVG